MTSSVGESDGESPDARERLASAQVLRIALMLHRASREPSTWDATLEALAEVLRCAEVFDVARRIREGGSDILGVLRELAENARHCTSTGLGACARCGDHDKRVTCAQLVEHLSYAVEHTDEGYLNGRRAVRFATLDDLEHPVIVIAEDLALVYANSAGRAILDEGGVLAQRAAKLRCVDLPDSHLQRHLANLSGQESDGRASIELASGRLRIRRLNPSTDLPTLFLLILEVATHTRAKAMAPEARREALSALGLTPRQLELASHLLDGLTVSAAAKAMDISRATANDHLAKLFHRAGTRRQVELVSWLASQLAK